MLTALAAEDSAVTVNVRDFGAIGNGLENRYGDREIAQRFGRERELRKIIPALSDDWSADEIAFELAKSHLPPEGGTIYFPAGDYIAAARGWQVMRDRITLRGDGAERSVLSTSARVSDGLVLAGYRHVGWSRGYAFGMDEGARGERSLTLAEDEAASAFRVGDLVFVRNGANRYDQDYGETNEIVALAGRRVTLKYPFSRDYRWSAVNWSGELAADFTLPKAGGSGTARFTAGEGFATPGKGSVISLGEAVLRVEQTSKSHEVVLRNPGRANPPAGTILPAGTRAAKERALVKLTATTRDFAAIGLTIRGRRKALNLSNTYNSRFEDCVIERVPGDADVSGGLTIDGDGGRFVRFERCTIRAVPAIGMQFARSFGGISFRECRFEDTNVAFTEFNFDGEVVNSRFVINGTRALRDAVIVGKSCGDLRVIDNVIEARGIDVVFDAHMDIQSFKVSGPRLLEIRGNSIATVRNTQIYRLARGDPDPRAHNSETEIELGAGD